MCKLGGGVYIKKPSFRFILKNLKKRLDSYILLSVYSNKK